MTNQGKLVKSKAQFSRDELANLLESIAVRIRRGSLTLGEGPDSVTIDLPESLRVEMEVEDSGTRQLRREFELEIKWPIETDGTPLETEDPTSGFTIS